MKHHEGSELKRFDSLLDIGKALILGFALLASVDAICVTKNESSSQKKASLSSSGKSNAPVIDELDAEMDEQPVAKGSADANGKTSPSSSNSNSNKVIEPEFIKQAKALEKNQQPQKASELLWKNIDKVDHENLVYLAQLHLRMKEPTEAMRVTTLMIAKNANDFEAHWLSGKALVMKYKDKEAADSFNKSIAAKKDFLPAYEDLSEVYTRGKNYYEIRIMYEDLIEAMGPRAEFLSKLCEVDALDGVNDQGLEYCRKAIAKNEKIASNFVWMGVIHKQLGDIEKAKSTLKSAADNFSKSELAQFTYAEFLRENKNFIEAKQYYEACLKTNEKAHSCFNGLGLVTYQIQKFDLSYAALKKACFIGGRKYASSVREALAQVRKSKIKDWLDKFEELSQQCAIQ